MSTQIYILLLWFITYDILLCFLLLSCISVSLLLYYTISDILYLLHFLKLIKIKLIIMKMFCVLQFDMIFITMQCIAANILQFKIITFIHSDIYVCYCVLLHLICCYFYYYHVSQLLYCTISDIGLLLLLYYHCFF